MANADCIVIQGSNMAECHPVGYQWVVEARMRGAKVIHVDPRFTRTTANADKHVPIRAGSDIVLLGALIHGVLEQDLFFDEYVRHYTNAANLISEDYQGPEDLEGLFSGFDPTTHTYNNATWQYALDEDGEPLVDPTLEDPRTVFQILKRHYARYTPEAVETTCGISPKDFDYLLRAVTENSGRDRTTCFAYAVGWTQHSLGAQFIRTASILQLLLGNMGRPGGGVMALRGHATIQGSTDIPTLFNLLPGYLPMPSAVIHDRFDDYLTGVGRPETQKGFWSNGDAYTVSLLKAWWGDAATEDNDFAFDYLPRINGAHGTYQTAVRMLEDGVDGFFVLGQNPAVGSANGRMQRMAMSHLKWLVVRDFSLIESATWWKDGPEIESGELAPEDIDTEVFFLPAANHTEKAGSFTQTQRLVQWRHKAVDPPGQAQSELDFFHTLGVKIRERLEGSEDPRDRPLLDLTWDYPIDEHGDVDVEAVIREINGFHIGGEDDGRPVDGFNELRGDGSTASGCWIYAGVYAGGENQAARRKPRTEQDETALEWGWAWPANRRILYNRASADPEGRPWSERKRHVWWDADAGRWTGSDVPDFPADRAPGSTFESAYGGTGSLRGDDPFIMQADGKGWLFAPSGMIDGPLPTHFEPQESTVRNPLYRQQNNPTRMTMPREDNLSAPGAGLPGSEVYPYVFTTYRLTEHHTAGGMSRWLPYLSELQPEMFCEVSPELAAEVGLEPYGWATIVSPRAAIEARVLVTKRMRPLTIAGQTIHQIGLPYHWGAGGGGAVVEGDSANDLLGVTMDPNVFIQASKSLAGAIMPGRRPRGPDRQDLVEKFRSEAGLTEESGNQHVTVPPEYVAASVAAGHLAEPLSQEELEVAYGPHGPGCTCDTPMVEGADFRRAEQPTPMTHTHTDDRTGRVGILPGAEAVAEGPAGGSVGEPTAETPRGDVEEAAQEPAEEDAEVRDDADGPGDGRAQDDDGGPRTEREDDR
ncbi:formate dehydrogenase major subunit [Brevibacterium sp. Mu109]|nr:formate dehydrogenase major subunit [Brevibacterium sp. Mu109]